MLLTIGTKSKAVDITPFVLFKILLKEKGIIIGKNGEMLKRISSYARQDLEKMFGTKVNLHTWVKVKEDYFSDKN